MAVWVVRGGQGGSYAQWALENGRAGAAWNNVPSLSDVDSREAVVGMVAPTLVGESRSKVGNRASQLWGLRQIQPGDIVILPLSATSTLAVGRCTHAYEHLDETAPARHTVCVKWERDDVPRSVLGQDLLNSLGSLLTVFRISRNGAEERFTQVLASGLDPDVAEGGDQIPTTVTSTDASETPVDPDPVPTLETIRDRVRTHVRKHYREHELTALVAAVLEARGFRCDVSPPGKDQGVDILAGTGPLGLDSPTLIVEVKSESGAIGAPVVRGLQGAISSHRADQGLLVAWGGITKDARGEIRRDRLTIRVWDADDLLDNLFEVYDQLPESLRNKVPMRRAWVLTETADE